MKKKTERTVPPLKDTWRRMVLASGTQDRMLRRSMAATILSAIVQGIGFSCFYPLLASVLTTTPQWQDAWFWASILAVCTVLDFLFIWTARKFDYSGSIAEVTHDLRISLGEQLKRIPLESLYRKRTGELSAVLAGNVDEVVTPMGMLSAAFISLLITPTVTVLATAFVDWRLALAMVAILPLIIPLYYWRRQASGPYMRNLAAAHARTTSELVEYTQGLPVLRATNQVGAQAKRLQDALLHLQETQTKSQMRQVVPGIVFSSIIQIGLIVALALGVWLITTGTLNAAALIALLVIIVRFSEPLTLLFGLVPVFDYMEAGFEQIETLLSVKPLPVPTAPDAPKQFDVTFQDVDFRYAETGEDILKDINFNLAERSMTALVGPSGVGKTTITRLIMRYADVQRGQVLIGGVDIRSMKADELMRHISVVFQDVYLFDDTIHANILMGRPDATDEEVEAAARSAYCHEFITRLPDGYQTRVGDIGGCLSGGERQRISIARAILKDAPIVILDEPTAALDTESELAVQQAIDSLVKGRTVIVIAHRLSTVVGADSILVFDEGRVIQHGKHADLIEKDGRYRDMWQAQQHAKDWHLAEGA